MIFDEHPYVNGYYEVGQVAIEFTGGSLVFGYFPFRCQLRRVGNFAAPLIEDRILGSVRPNSNSVTSCQPVTSWPATSVAWSGPAAVTSSHIRETADGRVRTYVDTAGTTPALLNGFVSALVPPEDYYTGSAAIKIGMLELAAVTTYAPTGFTEQYVVPEGVTEIAVDVRGAQGGGTFGGKGARVLSRHTVTPGEILSVVVGYKPGGPAGGFPNGGAGGDPTARGGGGRSEIRRGTTRLAVAGAGGGSAKDRPNFTGAAVPTWNGGAGGKIGVRGQPWETRPGKGGTQSVGGDGGVDGGFDGSDGASRQGGAGYPPPYSNSGGGGDGYYGGGGGSIYAAGGGGSSYSEDSDALFTTGYQSDHGIVAIIPIGADVEVNRYTVIGEQCVNSPLGWELTNGLVRCRPVNTQAAVAFEFVTWDGNDWGSPWIWHLTDLGSTVTPAPAYLASFVVIANNPAECIIRCTAEYVGKRDSIVLTLALKRGSPIVDVYMTTATAGQYGWRQAGGAAGTSSTGALEQTAPGGTGSSYLLFTTDVTTASTVTDPGRYQTADATKLTVGLGGVPDGSVSSSSSLKAQWHAAITESIRAVLR